MIEVDVDGTAGAERGLGGGEGVAQVGGIERSDVAIEVGDEVGFAIVFGDEVADERDELSEQFGESEAGECVGAFVPAPAIEDLLQLAVSARRCDRKERSHDERFEGKFLVAREAEHGAGFGGIVAEVESLSGVARGDAEPSVGERQFAGFGVALALGAGPEGAGQFLGADASWRDPIRQGLFGALFQDAVAMPVVEEFDGGGEEFLQVGFVVNLLVPEFADEPAFEQAVVGFDLAAGFGVPGADEVAVNAQESQAFAHREGIEGGAAVELHAIGEAEAGDGLAQHAHGPGGAFGRAHDRGENVATVVIEDRKHVEAAGAVGEENRERSLAVELPAFVGSRGFVAMAEPAIVSRSLPYDSGIGAMAHEFALEGRARELRVGKLELEIVKQLCERAPGLFGEERQCMRDEVGTVRSLPLTFPGTKAFETFLPIPRAPAQQRGTRDGTWRASPRPGHGLTCALAKIASLVGTRQAWIE